MSPLLFSGHTKQDLPRHAAADVRELEREPRKAEMLARCVEHVMLFRQLCAMNGENVREVGGWAENHISR